MSPATAERIYRVLLRAYPPDFRAEYGREMVLVFRQQCQENDVRSLGFWAAVLRDVARSAPALRAEAWLTMDVTMKLAAMLTVLLGVFSILSAVVEWVAGSKLPMDSSYVPAVVLGVFASALLLGAGVALLLGKAWSRQAARVGLVASLVCVVVARVLFPWMGPFLELVGFGLPVALLVALYWPRRPSTLGAASIVLALVLGRSTPAAALQVKPGDSTRAAGAVKDLPLTAAQREAYLGNYSVTLPFGEQTNVVIIEEDGVLKVQSAQGETRRLLYQGDGVFRPQGADFLMTFVLEDGRATRFTSHKADGVMTGVRNPVGRHE